MGKEEKGKRRRVRGGLISHALPPAATSTGVEMEDAFVRALAVLSAPGAHGAAREEADAFVTQALESSPLVAHLLLARIAPPCAPGGAPPRRRAIKYLRGEALA